MSEDLKQAALAGLEQTFDKERWFKPVRESVQGLTAAQAAWHSAPERHSVWQMVHHLTHYCRLAILRLDGAPIPENWREGEWGPREDPHDEGAWQQELRLLFEAHEQLRQRLAVLSPAAFATPLPHGHSPAWFALFGYHYHTAYHCGQIRLVRALQGLSGP